MNDEKWVRDEDWVGTTIDDSFVMVHVESGQYVSLNASANSVWTALEEPRTVAEIETRLMCEFDVGADTCRRSVATLLDRMRELAIAAPV